MEEDILVDPPDFKLYKARSIYVGTLLGGPLAAGYLIAANYRQLGEKGKVWKTWTATIIVTCLIFGIGYLIPADSKLPNLIFPLLIAYITSYIVERIQGESIKLHLDNNGAFYSKWRAAVVAIVFLAVTLGIIFLGVNYINPTLE